MAINQLNPVTNSLSGTITAQNNVYISQNDITITNYELDTAPQVTAGSVFSNNGTLFSNDALATPTGYAGISSSTEFFLYYDESGGVFIYAETAPTWSDAKQGWYNGNDRAFYSMFKDAGDTLYENKSLMINQSKSQINGDYVINGGIDVGSNGIPLKQKVLSLTLSADTSFNISHGLTDGSKIRGVSSVFHGAFGIITGWNVVGAIINFTMAAASSGEFYCVIFYID